MILPEDGELSLIQLMLIVCYFEVVNVDGFDVDIEFFSFGPPSLQGIDVVQIGSIGGLDDPLLPGLWLRQDKEWTVRVEK